MSVLIRGMDKIPEDGTVLMVKHDDNGKVYIKYAGMMGYSMELVKIKEPYGRLIDADAFAENIKTIIERQGYGDMTIGKFTTVKDVLEAVVTELKGTGPDRYENAPTVIEAEEVSE